MIYAYLIPGLGADKRIFERLDLGIHQKVVLEWITPPPNESMEQYAVRLLPQINDDLPTLIGVSFGGMIAVELSKYLPNSRVILISSAKYSRDIPLIYRIAGKLKLHQLLPIPLLKSYNVITGFLFGVKNEVEKKLLTRLLLGKTHIFPQNLHKSTVQKTEFCPIKRLIS